MGSYTRSVSPAAGAPEPPNQNHRGSISGPSGSKFGDRESEADDKRPPKRRKTKHEDQQLAPDHAFPDVVTKGIITEQEARELFAM